MGKRQIKYNNLVLVAEVLAGVLLMLQGSACETGRTLFAAKLYAAAQVALWECVAAGAPGKEYAHQLVLTYREQKNYDAGLAHTQSRLAGQPASIDLLYVAGFLQFRRGWHRESLGTLERAYRLDPNDWRVHQLFGLNYVVLNVKDGALVSLENAIRLNPTNPELYYQLARLYYSDSRPHESIAASRQALALFPEYTEAYDNLGLCYEALADYERARKSYEQAVRLSRRHGGTDEWPLLNYAAFLIKQGATEASLPLLREASERNPASAKTQYLLGRALRKLGRLAEARQALEQSLQLDTSDPAPHYELGMLLTQAGERTRARALLDRFQVLQRQAAP